MSATSNTLQEYWDILNAFDWHYNMSDDHRVWTAGVKREAEVVDMAKQSPEHQNLFADFQDYIYSVESGGKPKALRPERSQ